MPALCSPLQEAIVRDSGEAEDVVQEAFSTCIRNQCFLTVQRALQKIGLLKSRFTGRWTGSRT